MTDYPRPKAPESDPDPEYGYLTRPLPDGASAWEIGYTLDVILSKEDLKEYDKHKRVKIKQHRERGFSAGFGEPS